MVVDSINVGKQGLSRKIALVRECQHLAVPRVLFCGEDCDANTKIQILWVLCTEATPGLCGAP